MPIWAFATSAASVTHLLQVAWTRTGSLPPPAGGDASAA